MTQEQLLTVVDAEGNTETITCTTEHPFWVPGQGWTAAGDLTPGTELTSPDGSMVMVVSNTVQVLAQPVNVYNFEVEGDHTYFVDQGGEPVWVHNWCTPSEQSAINKITNILTKNFKGGPLGDISGAVSDMVGNPIWSAAKNRFYDHVQDLGSMLKGLRNGAAKLASSTDPLAMAARGQALSTIQEIEGSNLGFWLMTKGRI